MKKIIEFKGTKDGFIINIKEKHKLDLIKLEISNKINLNLDFFKGAKFIGINSEYLKEEDIKEIINFVKDEFSINFVEMEKKVVNYNKKLEVSDIAEKKESFLEELPTKFVKNTIRSGGFVDYDGNIVVLGDVNPGAQLIATGNIIVMGSLRGIAHAGSKGDSYAFVAANKLNPIQLRISDVIAIPPDEQSNHTTEPQIAFVSDNIIVIDSYQTRVKIME